MQINSAPFDQKPIARGRGKKLHNPDIIVHLTVKVVINLFDATKFDARNSNFRALYLPIIYHASHQHIIDKLDTKMNILPPPLLL